MSEFSKLLLFLVCLSFLQKVDGITKECGKDFREYGKRMVRHIKKMANLEERIEEEKAAIGSRKIEIGLEWTESCEKMNPLINDIVNLVSELGTYNTN